MPIGNPTPMDDEGSIGEQLLGRGDNKRSTKTFIEDGPLAMYLGLVRGMPQTLINTGRRLHSEETGIPFSEVTPQLIMDTYPEVRELIELHQQIIEHKGSQGGFIVDRFVQRSSQQELEEQKEKKTGSGQSSEGNKRWS